MAPLDLNPPAGLRVFITGGAHGIGRATAEAYAARGARICILDRTDVKDAPADWVCRKGSATSAEDTEAALAEMDRRWGGVDVAFANAGMAANKPSLDLTQDDQLIDLVVLGDEDEPALGAGFGHGGGPHWCTNQGLARTLNWKDRRISAGSGSHCAHQHPAAQAVALDRGNVQYRRPHAAAPATGNH